MEFKKIQDLIKLVDKTNIAEVSIEEDNFKLKLKTKEGVIARQPTTQVVSAPVAAQPAVAAAPAPSSTPAAAPEPAPTEAKPADPAPAPAADDSKYTAIKSPMVGTFYRAPGPDKDVFVNVGDQVSQGSVLCVIEAMKLFNEIESEISGKVVKVLADDASPVEYDQPLFLIDPS